MTDGYSMNEAKDFIDWMNDLDFKHKIFIAGNHDRLLELRNHERDILLGRLDDNVIYLEESEIVIEGIKIYGTPYQPTFRDWAFNLLRHGEELASKYAAIPDDTDILITHTPPKGILDEVGLHNTGTNVLLSNVQRVAPKIHAFGHIHECPGTKRVSPTLFINAAQVDRSYNVVNEPITIEWDDSKPL